MPVGEKLQEFRTRDFLFMRGLEGDDARRMRRGERWPEIRQRRAERAFDGGEDGEAAQALGAGDDETLKFHDQRIVGRGQPACAEGGEDDVEKPALQRCDGAVIDERRRR